MKACFQLQLTTANQSWGKRILSLSWLASCSGLSIFDMKFDLLHNHNG